MRRENWTTELANYVASRTKTPFRWGRHDCCVFAGLWVERCVGFNPMAEYVYRTAKQARDLLASEGGLEKLVASVCALWGWAECSPLRASRGDVVLLATSNGPALGICVGSRCAFASKVGLYYVLTGDVSRAWHIT